MCLKYHSVIPACTRISHNILCCITNFSHFILIVSPINIGQNDFHAAENNDGIADFDNKNGIKCKTQNITEMTKMWPQSIKI